MSVREPIDPENPRSILEEIEETAGENGLPLQSAEDRAAWMRRVMTWILDGKTLVAVATRSYVAAYVACPEVVEGITLHQIARLSGHGRSAAHNLVREFERKFKISSIHARTPEARQKYSDAFHARNGARPHTYNPAKGKK